MTSLVYAWGLSPVAFFLLAFVLFLTGVRLWLTRGRSRLPIVVWALALIAAAPAVTGVPVALTNAGLLNLPAGTSIFPVLRLGVLSPGDSPPIWFYPKGACPYTVTGTGDIGGCVESPDGKWWVAAPGILTFEQFGAGATVTDSRAAINAAIQAACGLFEPILPLSVSYNVATFTASSGENPGYAVLDNCGARLLLPPVRPLAWFKSVNLDVPSGGVNFIWTGGNQTTPFYLAYLGPLSGNNKEPFGQSWQDVYWDCAKAAGCAGAAVRSTQSGNYGMTAWEPRPVYLTASGTAGNAFITTSATPTGVVQGLPVTFFTPTTVGTVTGCPGSNPGCAGQAVVPVASTANIIVGEYVNSPYIPQNTTVASIGSGQVTLNANLPVSFAGGEAIYFSPILAGTQIVSVSGTQVNLNAKVAATFTSQQVAFGGEGLNFGVTPDLSGFLYNDLQYATINAAARNTGTGVQAPGIFFAGVNQSGHGGGASGTEYGNFSSNTIHDAECSFVFGGSACIVVNNSDHNLVDFLFAAPAVVGGAPGPGMNLSVLNPLSGSVDGGGAHWQVKVFGANLGVWGSGAGFASPGIVDWTIDDLIVLPNIGSLSASQITCGTGVYGVRYRFDYTNPNQDDSCNAVANVGGTISNGTTFNSHFANGLSNATITGPTCTMMGLGAQATPLKVHANNSGLTTATIFGYGTLSGGTANLTLYTGTGTPPALGAACTGSALATFSLPATDNFNLSGTVNAPSVVATGAIDQWFDLGGQPTSTNTLTASGLYAIADEKN